jgi:hypothetical protein
MILNFRDNLDSLSFNLKTLLRIHHSRVVGSCVGLEDHYNFIPNYTSGKKPCLGDLKAIHGIISRALINTDIILLNTNTYK